LEKVKIVMLCSVTVTSDSQKTFENLYMLLPKHVTSGGSRPGIWGCSQIGGPKKVFTCLNIKGCLRQSLGITRKWLFLLVELCNFSGNNNSWKHFISNVWSGSQKLGIIFHKLHNVLCGKRKFQPPAIVTN